jgi:hypothetical protein
MSIGAWPSLNTDRLPALPEAVTLAEAVRREVLGPERVHDPLLDINQLLSVARCQLTLKRLGGADGSPQALIMPMENDSFCVLVDSEPVGGWCPYRGDTDRHRTRFLIGHELGHTFFYVRVPGEPPKRWAMDSSEQEEFCDSFSCALLCPPAVVAATAPTPENIAALSRQYDVSVQLTVRAFADVHRSHSFALLYQDRSGPWQLIPQWNTNMSRYANDWWERSVQTVPRSAARTVLLPLKDGGTERWKALVLPERSQALLVSEVC